MTDSFALCASSRSFIKFLFYSLLIADVQLNSNFYLTVKQQASGNNAKVPSKSKYINYNKKKSGIHSTIRLQKITTILWWLLLSVASFKQTKTICLLYLCVQRYFFFSLFTHSDRFWFERSQPCSCHDRRSICNLCSAIFTQWKRT